MNLLKYQHLFDGGEEEGGNAPGIDGKIKLRHGVAPQPPASFGTPSPAHSEGAHHGSQKRKGRKGNCYLTPGEWELIISLQKKWSTPENKLSEMGVVSDLVRKGLQFTVENQHAALLEPRIETTIVRVLGNYTNRTDSLLARIFYAMEFFRLLFVRFFKLFVGNDKMVDELVVDLDQEARNNIKKKYGN
jgi:hypothetical protein